MKFTFEPESQPLDGYTIQRALAKGGFGEVYLARSDAGKQVALKLLRDNFEVELRGIRQCLNLKHANIVPIYDIKVDADGDHWIVMEYVAGQTLAEILDSRPSGLPLETVTRYLKDIGSGLSYLHEQGIVHRDLKPANIFEENGVLKIGDVGLSKFINESQRSAQTQSVGTVSYMAPEVSRGRYGKRMDVYSLAVMLYEMLCGQLPFQGDTPGEVLMRHLTEHPDLSRVPRKFRPVLARALHKDPEKRTRTVDRLVEEFEAALNGTAAAEPIFNDHDPQEALRAEVEHHKKSPPRPDRWTHEKYTRARKPEGWLEHNWPWLIVISLLMLFLVPGLLGGMITFGATLIPFVLIMGILGWGVYKLFQEAFGDSRSKYQPHVRKETVPPKRKRPVAQKLNSRHASRLLTPDTPRDIPFQQRMAELLGSLGMAAFFSVAVSGLLWWWTDSVASAMQAATLSLCLTFAAGGILTENKFLEGRRVEGLFRRFRMFVIGGIVGAVIFWLNSWLLMPLDFGAALSLDQLIRGMGPDRMLAVPGRPVSDFMLYFALLFGLRRWWWHADSFRTARVRIGSLLGTFLLSLVIPIFVSFPFSWSVLIATGLSAVVQLSAAWCPPEERTRMVTVNSKGGTES